MPAGWCRHLRGALGLCTRPELTCGGDGRAGPRGRAAQPWRACQGAGKAEREPHKAPRLARGASSHSLSGLGRLQESSGVGLLRALRGDEGRGELRDFRSLKRHSPSAAEVQPTPFHCPNGDPERRRGRDWIPTPSLSPKFSPSYTQILCEAGRARVSGSRTQGGEWSACPSSQGQRGGNSSSQESKLPRV